MDQTKAAELEEIRTLKATENPETGRPFTFNEMAAGPLKSWGLTGARLAQIAKLQLGHCPACQRKLRKENGK